MSFEDNDTEAVEYVLGLMDREDRRRFEAALLDDPALAESVWRAEEMLVGLAEAVKARPVPPHVKRGLDQRLFGRSGQSRGRDRQAVRFWRGVSGVLGAATVAGLALVAVLVARPEVVVAPSQQLIAAIVRPDGSVMLARLREDGLLVAEAFPIADTGSPELWLLPEGGAAPISIGLLEAAERTRFEVPEQADALVRSGSQLAITLEPQGGSPTGQPTGPVIGAGPLTDI